MKELSIKEKAERYDELLKKLRKAKVDNDVCNERYCCVIDDIVPELEEGEDEKTKRILHSILRKISFHLRDIFTEEEFQCFDVWSYVWLKKQGESDETKAKMFLIDKGYPIDANGTFPTYEEMYNIIREGLENQGEQEHQYKSRPRYVGEEELLGANKQGEQILANSAKTCKDEQKPYGKREECYDCQMNYGGTCKGSCAMKRGEQKPAWSEEDEKIIQWIATDIKRLINDNKKANIIADQEIKWLESLRPQNRWKPSDEQMTALRRMKAAIAGEGEIYKPLNSLYEDLKKLREE